MTIATHAFPRADMLEAEYQRSLRKIARMTELAQLETSDKRSVYRSLFNESQMFGTIASVLMSDGDATARSHLADAERYGRRLLSEVDRPMKVGEIEVSYGRSGPPSVVVRDLPQAESTPLGLHHFYDALLTTLAFGDASALEAFATFPEAGYRSPNIIASEGIYALMRAYQAWLSGDQSQARAELEIVARSALKWKPCGRSWRATNAPSISASARISTPTKRPRRRRLTIPRS